MTEFLSRSWQEVTALTALFDAVIVAATVAWILSLKKDSTSALAWCLLVLLVPFFGAAAFYLFGYQSVQRPLARKRRHARSYREHHPAHADADAAQERQSEEGWQAAARLARRLGAMPLTHGNAVTLYHDGPPAFDAMADAVRSATGHVHFQFFIIQPDATGERFFTLLAERARAGVEVRVLFDAVGSYRLKSRLVRRITDAGGQCRAFLPINPLRRRVQINLRNHRKILVADGRVAFTGGLNVGEEYLSRVERFGYWRDTHLRVEGPAVPSLQRVFAEDWDFAAGENLTGPRYFPELPPAGPAPVQVVQSGPDVELKSVREVYFAAATRARKRLWVTTPYFVPDAGLKDALCLAGRSGIDVRLLCPFRPDKWVPYMAARYYWSEVLEAGVKVYQYAGGFVHSKVVTVDGEWASVGTANWDNRSLHLNFEVNCLVYDPAVVAELDGQFRRDLVESVRLDPAVYARRPLGGRLIENACRLFSPVL